MIILKRLARFVLDLLVRATEKTALGERFQDRMVTRAMMKTSSVRHGDLALEFAVPSRLSRWRVATFSTKEPETLEWIDAIPKESVVWDIGANIGLYSVYAAKQRHCKVLAFEPSVFNLELLARNISLNDVADRICIVPLALNKIMGPIRCISARPIGEGLYPRLEITWAGTGNPFGKSLLFRRSDYPSAIA